MDFSIELCLYFIVYYYYNLIELESRCINNFLEYAQYTSYSPNTQNMVIWVLCFSLCIGNFSHTFIVF